MTHITNCPSCNTQFIVTDEQLSQHNGKVRCGQCFNVFDATKELVDLEVQTEADLNYVNDETDIQSAEINEANSEPLNDSLASKADDIVNKALLLDSQAKYFNDDDKKSESRSTLLTWLKGLFILVLLLAAITQSIYFFRTEIALYYPNLKPYLVLACEKIACSVDLPKKIEFIIIDDSDMQEDADYAGLVHLSSTLINQANFSQAYPNLELTLTDINDKPKLRRTFKPEEYLPEHTVIENGLAGGGEVKVKLAITATGESVAGYRIAVHY
ncbi:MAG: zinc-ribbon and DUF3426 domain-containing protein [Methylotenera sp.]|nr:zinc-ribbon and DUF3426 domain-containing protein [Methylotenera sp.]